MAGSALLGNVTCLFLSLEDKKVVQTHFESRISQEPHEWRRQFLRNDAGIEAMMALGIHAVQEVQPDADIQEAVDQRSWNGDDHPAPWIEHRRRRLEPILARFVWHVLDDCEHRDRVEPFGRVEGVGKSPSSELVRTGGPIARLIWIDTDTGFDEGAGLSKQRAVCTADVEHVGAVGHPPERLGNAFALQKTIDAVHVRDPGETVSREQPRRPCALGVAPTDDASVPMPLVNGVPLSCWETQEPLPARGQLEPFGNG